MSKRSLRALIVDDEPLARRGIRQLAARYPDLVIVGECRNGAEALRTLEHVAADVVFLDVQMPVLDGFGVIRARGASRMPAVIFVTAFDEYAVRAFEAHAADYLVKPVTESRFDLALQRVRERLDARNAIELAERLNALLANVAPAGPKEDTKAWRLVVPTAAGDLILDANEIDWIEADDYYAAIHVGNRRHLLRESLASLARRLEASDFVRVHRSAVVNVARVRELRTTGGEVVIVLRNGTEIPVSRRRRELIASILRRIGREGQ